MPRISSAEEKPKKRATRKRAVATKSRATRKTVPRRTAVTKTARRQPEAEIEKKPAAPPSISRKAPTSIPKDRQSHRAKRKQLGVLAIIFLVGVGSSAAIGFTDKGIIDVNEAIEARNERMRNGQASESEVQRIVIPVQNTAANQLPDGGLIGKGDVDTPPEPVAVVAPSASTSSESSATSTEAEIESADGSIEDDQVDSEDVTTDEADDSTPAIDSTEVLTTE